MTVKKKSRGRPAGSRNKVSASDEISKALSRGMGLIELKEWLWDQLQSEDITDLQKSKYATMYVDLMKFLHVEGTKLSSKDDKQKEVKDSNQEQPTQQSTIHKFDFSKKKAN